MKDRSLRHCKTGGPAQFTGTPRIVAVYNVKGDPFQKHGVAAFDVVDGSVFVCVSMWVPEDMHVYLAIDRVMKLLATDHCGALSGRCSIFIGIILISY